VAEIICFLPVAYGKTEASCNQESQQKATYVQTNLMNWYYVEQGQQAGPVDDSQLDQMRASGRIQDDTLIWREGMGNWQPYREIRGASASASAAQPVSSARLSPAPASTTGTPDAVCAECGNMFPKENMIRYGNNWICASCKPVFMQKVAEGARLNTGELRYAGFWVRFGAKLIDGLILGVVFVVPVVLLIIVISSRSSSGSSPLLHLGNDNSLHATTGMPSLLANMFGLVFQFFFIAANAIYSGFFVGKYGATPGKMACKLIVVDANGAPVSYGRAFGRGFAEILSRMICNIGYIIAAFDGQKRALHDHICSTRVIYK
jgi:uncharacterized RDD family membrane protein YckC